jgi:hypothetical protein
VVWSGAAFAQGLGVVQGTITDSATGKPVTDVVVTATSPAKQGEELVVTDGSGNYYLPQLPPGTYTLRFEKESFKPFSRADISVRADRTLRVNVELLPESLKAEEVVIVSKAPTIDVATASTGQSVSADFVKNIAVSRPTGVGGQQLFAGGAGHHGVARGLEQPARVRVLRDSLSPSDGKRVARVFAYDCRSRYPLRSHDEPS